mgnify:CR=1 FL=1
MITGLRYGPPRYGLRAILHSRSIKTTMRPLTLDSVNPALLKVEYAVRGELAIKAEKYRVQLSEEAETHGLPFDRVINSNIGNPQQKGLEQPPITFTRQVCFGVIYSCKVEAHSCLGRSAHRVASACRARP